MSDNKIFLGMYADNNFYTITVLMGNRMILLAEFTADQKSEVIEKIKNDYPVFADKLKNIDLLKFEVSND